MKSSASSTLQKACRKLLKITASERFFYFIIALASMQVIWYALSFHPWINDESHHFGFISAYTESIGPFLSVQNTEWDFLGQITRSGSYLFHYVMSWPLRITQLITDSYMAQVVVLRLICAVMFIVGLIFYRKAFLEIGKLPRSVVHTLLLFFILTPAAGLLAGTINYDNLVFLMFAYVLLLSVRILRDRSLRLDNLMKILIVGLLMCLVKWSALALFIPVVIFISYELFKKYGKQLPVKIAAASRKLPRLQFTLLLLGVIIAGLLFIERPVINVIKYDNPSAACTEIISEERCLNSPTYASYDQLAKDKPADFEAQDPARYFFDHWLPTMTIKASNLLELGDKGVLPIVKLLYYAAAYTLLVVILLCLRPLIKNIYNRFFLLIIIVSAGLLILDEYMGYVNYGEPVAIRARYLVPILPLLFYLGAISLIELFGKYKRTLIFSAAIVLLISLQGGSITTQLFTAPESAYWKDTPSYEINSDIKTVLDSFIKQ